MIPLNWFNLHTIEKKEAEKNLDRVMCEFKPMEKERLDSEINYDDFAEDETVNLEDYTFELLVSDKLSEEDIDMIYAVTPRDVNIKITNEGFDSFNNTDKVILNSTNSAKKHIELKGLLQLMKYINDREGGKC